MSQLTGVKSYRRNVTRLQCTGSLELVEKLKWQIKRQKQHTIVGNIQEQNADT